MLRSRRIALIATIAVIGLSACGDAGSTTTAGKQPAVIHIGAVGSAGGAKIAAGASESADSMMMPFQDITYVYDGSYPDLGTSAPAWMLPGSPTVDQARVAQLAKLLGVEGEVRALTPEMGGGWMVGAEDYSTSNLTVAADGMMSWWFNPAPIVATTPAVECVYGGTEPAVAPDATGDTESTDQIDTPAATMPLPLCEEPTPPVGVPTKDAALASAKTLFADMGYDVSQLEFDTYADEWGANVTGFVMLGGFRSPITVSVGYGENGAVTWASGSLATPQEAGEYPLVNGEAALQRLNDQDGMWAMYGSPGMMAKGGAALDATTAIATREVSQGSGTDAVAETVAPAPDDAVTSPGVVIDPMPVDSLPPMEPVTVHLNAMKLDLTMVWAEDGTIWLLPAYTFTAVDEGDFAGGQYTIIAVDDAFIDTPDPMPTETVVPDTAAPVETIAPADTVAPSPELTVDQVDGLVGLSLDEATKVAEENGWTVRVAVLDGEVQAGTMDLQPNRVNVAVEAGVVTSVDSVG